MKMRLMTAVLAASAVALTTGAVTGSAVANAKGRPCGDPVMKSGAGTLGTPWTLKSMYDDDGPGLVAGEPDTGARKLRDNSVLRPAGG
ncbi:hypothetical protein [Nocardia sp. alder85J]|uniref:hypothetical protein n=1 Tax=Nocardia sp. alder85J TaxID=2862949 RepID=UPI001CD1C63C|nr:hypothetical protein [Nocardia sp. alder85J]MCX4092558.1 hypothetical protein [Nocardia sp. alder85J]